MEPYQIKDSTLSNVSFCCHYFEMVELVIISHEPTVVFSTSFKITFSSTLYQTIILDSESKKKTIPITKRTAFRTKITFR